VSDVVVVIVTAPSAEVGEQIAGHVVGARAAACVAILPGMRSVYRWQGAIERADEVQLIIKTAADRIADLRAAVVAVHPYQVPEFLVLPVTDGLPAYLAWVVDETRRPPETP
jgi:periplasmic divalent cation tolerance protein